MRNIVFGINKKGNKIMSKVRLNIYDVNIYDNQNYLIDTISVEAPTKLDAEEEAFDIWLNEIRDGHYAVVEDESDE